MELVLKRYKFTTDYTLSRLCYKNLLSIDLVEPPIEGLSPQPLSTMPVGFFKLFLKANIGEISMRPRFQKCPGKPFFYISPLTSETALNGISFIEGENYKPNFVFHAGKINGDVIYPAPSDFDRLVTIMCFALKNREKIVVEIKNLKQ